MPLSNDSNLKEALDHKILVGEIAMNLWRNDYANPSTKEYLLFTNMPDKWQEYYIKRAEYFLTEFKVERR